MIPADGICIGMEPFRTARLSSNSVRVTGPERMVVVDAGGDPEVLRRHLDAIRAAQPAPPLPVCLVQTHAHIDHIAGLTDFGVWPEGWRFELAAHSEGLRILRQGDPIAALADLTGRTLRPFRPPGWRFWTVLPNPGAAAVEPDRAIPLGGGVNLEAFCTPGHSPDSVTWRVGNVLFIGDLLAATAPLVAGIPGWDRSALLVSLARLEQLMKAYRIEQVHVGHGAPLGPEAVADAIARSRREAGDLIRIEPVDSDRLRHMAGYAEGLIGELEELFLEMTRRIARLADKLAQVQEIRAADEVRGFDRSGEARDLQAAFERFKRTAHGQGDGFLGVAAKGVQTVQRISDLLSWERLDEVLDESFLRFVRTRVVDFIQRAKGLSPARDLQSADVAEAVRAYARRLLDQQDAACSLGEAEKEGEAALRRRLVACLARTPSLGTATLDLSLPAEAVSARMDSVRFFDALTRWIEQAVDQGAARFALRLLGTGSESLLELDAETMAWPIPGQSAMVWEIIFARAGARVLWLAMPGRPLSFVFES